MSALTYAGRDRQKALFTGRGHVVVVDTKYLTAEVLSGDRASEARSARDWRPGAQADPLLGEIAEAALRAADDHVLELAPALGRGFTVPKRVSASAAAVAGSPGLSPMSALAASLLAAGGQVTGADVLWVHRFFEHSTADEAGPEKWAAWGGSEGRHWAGQLAQKLEYDSVTADAGEFDVPGLQAFRDGDDDTRAFWASLTPGGRVDALLRLGPGGEGWLCWGNGDWAECAGPPAPRVELDDESALYAAGALLDAPDRPVDLRALNPSEWLVASAAVPGIDWELLGRVVTAAGEQDGEYTPEERSENASSQLRDANGRFAQVGDSGLIKSNGLRGTIETVNEQAGQVVVKAEDGNTYMVPSKDFEVDGGDGSTAPGKPDPSKITRPLDLSGILGQPRATATTPRAWLKRLLQPMGAGQLKRVVDDYEGFINDERQARAGDFEGGTGWEESRAETDAERKERRAHEENRDDRIAEVEEFYRKYSRRRRAVSASGDEQPAPGDAPAGEKVTPDNSDVPPFYMAIVDRDDPRAVMELIALVPAGPNDSAAATFKRAGGEWVEDPKIMQDLRSPTPPPVVKLPDEEYRAVLEQVDSEPAEPEGEAVTAGLYTEDDLRRALDGASAPCAKCGEELRYSYEEDGWPGVDGSVGCPEGGSHEADYPAAVSAHYAVEDHGGGNVVLSLVSAGGADRNRGNAETLRRYWTTGEGGVKIRWNSGGDWRRCVRYLSKHLGPRAKGYCALRHHEMTGMWPGDAKNRKEYAMAPDASTVTSLDDVRRMPAVIRASAQQAAVEAALAKVRGDEFRPVPVSASDIDEGRSGRAFKISIVVPEGISSGDKRHFQKGSLGLRTLPLPLLWQVFTGEGHDGSPIVGRIDHVERTSAGLGNAYGVFDTGPYGREAQRLVESGMLRWISVDLDKFEVDEELSERDPDGKMNIRKGRMMAATLVSKPAFQECTIELMPLAEELDEPAPAPVSAISASASIAAAIPVEPPTAWFEAPALKGPTPIHVEDDGRVYGHIATWSTSHIGMANSTKPPRSGSGYAYFHTGVVRTGEGRDVRVGQLTLAGGHADLSLDAASAARHYDDTASAVADVHAGEDSYGIWVAGALRPGTTPEQIRALRASAPSGDWRYIAGAGLELVAVCQVNVPGFPVPRALAASGAAPTALVAAGTAELLAIRAQEDGQEVEALAAAARQRIFLALDPDGYLTEFKDFPAEKREALAKEGKALKDGSFPIENAADLRRAVKAYGRASKDKQAAVRRHIVKRARALGKADLVPSDWREAALSDDQIAVRDRYAGLVASAREARVAALRDRIERPRLEAEAAALRERLGL